MRRSDLFMNNLGYRPAQSEMTSGIYFSSCPKASGGVFQAGRRLIQKRLLFDFKDRMKSPAF